MADAPAPAPLGILLTSGGTVAAVAPAHLPLTVATSRGAATVYLPPSPSKLAAAQAEPVPRAVILAARGAGGAGASTAAAIEALRLQGVGAVVGVVPRGGGVHVAAEEALVRAEGMVWSVLDVGADEGGALGEILRRGALPDGEQLWRPAADDDVLADPGRVTVDTVISARWVVPMEPDEHALLHDHAVVVDGGKIVAVLPVTEADARFAARERVDRGRSVVLPGLINAHTHSGMSLMRGMADDENLMKWLQETVWPVEAAFCSVPGFCEDGALLAATEMARGGITTFCDMYFYPECAARAALRVGMRAVLGMVVIMYPSDYAKDVDEYIDKGHAVREQYKDESSLHFTYAPHAPYTVPDSVWERLRDLSQASGLLINTHMHETSDECAASAALDRSNAACHQSEHAVRPLANFARIGLLSRRLLCAHMTQLTDEEIALCAEHRVSVAHCPTSNAKLGSGFCPVDKLLDAGVTVALGTDSAASNNSLDLFAEMKMAALVAKNVAGDATVVPAASALRMATRNGAEALGIGDVTGSLRPGKAADLIVVDMETHAGNTPVFDVRSALVYAAARTDVSDVFVEGRGVVRDRALVGVDEAEVVRKARGWALKMLAKFPPKDPSVLPDALPPSPVK